MKNFQVKASFLSTLQPLEQILIGDMFEKISPLEDKYGKDCSEFNSDNIKKFFTKYLPPSNAQLEIWCQLLQRYTDYIKGLTDNQKSSYAQYEAYAAKIKALAIKESIPQKYRRINNQMIFGEAEFDLLRSKLYSPYDKLILQAVYEGFDFSERCRDFIGLELKHCDPEKNVVYLSEERELSVSSILMELLLECANSNSYKNSSKGRLRKISEEDEFSKRCFKIIKDSPDDAELRRRFASAFRKVKDELSFSEKNISQYTLRMSGYINGLRKLGVQNNFDDPQILKNPEIYEWAARYQLADKTATDYKRTIRRCMIDVD